LCDKLEVKNLCILERYTEGVWY